MKKAKVNPTTDSTVLVVYSTLRYVLHWPSETRTWKRGLEGQRDASTSCCVAVSPSAWVSVVLRQITGAG